MKYYHHHHHDHLLLLFLVIFSFGLISADEYGCQNNSPCGGIEIKYPFWEDPGEPEYYCGNRELKVTCENNKTLTFNTNTDSYTVKSINYEDKTLSLVDTDVLSESCPRVRHNVSISNIPLLGYDPDVTVNLTFFFNCSSVSADYDQLSPSLVDLLSDQSTCLDPNFKTYVFVGEVMEEEISQWLSKKCKDQPVVAPVVGDGLNQSNVDELFPAKLKDGFELQWDESRETKNCTLCQNSQGICGYLKDTGNGYDFYCFCKDGKRLKDGICQEKSNGNSRKPKIIIGSVAAGGLFLCVVAGVCLFFCCRKYKNNKSMNSPFLSALVRSFSSDPSVLSKDTEYQSKYHFTHIFSCQELEDATDGFHASKEIGDGGFGTVYKGNLRDGRVVAVKRLYENNYKRMEQFMNEILILGKIRHPNLVALYGCTSRQCRELLLVYEYVPNGTVADHLHGSKANPREFNWRVRMNAAVETASALAYLHSTEPQIIHRDIKTHNILLDDDFHVKVADFGLSRLFPLDVTHVSTAPQGTPGYVDPEYYQCYQLTDKSDVYSFGVVLVELISSKPAVDITRKRSEINLSSMAINKIRDGLVHELADPELGFETDPETTRMIRSVAELAFLCLQAEKDLRPSMEDVKAELMNIADGGRRKDDIFVDIDRQKEDLHLLHHSVPFSPDSVTMQWNSRTTTPHASG